MTLVEAVALTPQELNSMTARELRAVAKTIRDVANKRITALAKVDSGHIAPAWERTRNGNKFKAPGRGAKVRDILRDIYEARGFVTSPTSRVRGARDYLKQVRTAADEMAAEYDDVGLLLRDIRRYADYLFTNYGSDIVYQAAREAVELGVPNALNYVKRAVDTIYEERQRAINDLFNEWEDWDAF